MELGEVQAIDGLWNIMNSVIWYPENYSKTKLKKNGVPLELKAEAYYCDECMKVMAHYKEK